jgi:integrase
VPQKSPVAWSFETVQKLVRNVIDDKTDWINGIQYGTYWGSLFSAAWDSALRLGDLLSIEYGWIQKRHGCGFLRIIQSKTQREHQVQLNKCTMRLIERSIEQSPHRRLIWPLKTTRKRFYRDVKAIIQKANESGSFRYFRRSAVTFSESQSPGSGQRLAAHRDSRTTRESYIDPLLLPESVVTVKPLSR